MGIEDTERWVASYEKRAREVMNMYIFSSFFLVFTLQVMLFTYIFYIYMNFQINQLIHWFF